MGDAREAHLAMIQRIINRLSQSSFLLKGWSVLLVSALLAFAANSSEVSILLVAFLPAIAFWGLDGYFLRQERLFRKLYDHARTADPSSVDYGMDTSPFLPRTSWLRATFSRTLIAFHGALGLTIVIVIIVTSVRS